MLLVFDENIPIRVAELLQSMNEEEGLVIEHNYTLGLRGFLDTEFIKAIKTKAGTNKCAIVTGDGRMLKRKPEIQALKDNGIIDFICAPSFTDKPLFDRAAYILNSWFAILDKLKKAKPGDVYVLPACRGHWTAPSDIKKK
ncbi:MAG: hypothetical protein LBO78_02765 [Rickettsiales bacterium]|jgi:hypothetical protein|nr:hypothetical protein [Rickettsiales bacterium]